ncbi:MAG: glycosyltransferase family 9 protein [Candidatus Wallbacteria bacterium]|nr:glycosyltransferase family 9 protein [Candidatus Wallbacteria bacterium]
MRTVRTDCRHYLGDRPCAPHKHFGAVCDACEYYRPRGRRILIVKLDAMGDVLRTTCILEPLTRAETEGGVPPHITWVAGKDSLPLLSRNPYVARVVGMGYEALALAQSERFDLVICLDASAEAARLATLAFTSSAGNGAPARAVGFQLRDGVVLPVDEKARTWWQMGLWDDLKRENTRSYQSHMMEMLGLEGDSGEYVLPLEVEELEDARRVLRSAGLSVEERFLALNVGGGGRWEFKRWSEPHLASFMPMVAEQLGLQVALFGGELEMPLIGRLMERAPRGTFFPGVHPVRRFAGMLAAAAVVVTSDSLAMHLALATKRPTVVLFGPTSVAEIEVFGRGEKLAPEMDCLCCYLPRCERRPYCQELIEPATVLDAVRRLLARGGESRLPAGS